MNNNEDEFESFSNLCNKEMLEVAGECIIFNDFLPAQGQWDHYTPTVTPHCLVIGRKLYKSQIIIRLWGELVAFGRFLDFQVSCIYVWFVNLIHKTSTVFIHVHVHNYIYLCTIFKQKKFFFQQIYKWNLTFWPFSLSMCKLTIAKSLGTRKPL